MMSENNPDQTALLYCGSLGSNIRIASLSEISETIPIPLKVE